MSRGKIIILLAYASLIAIGLYCHEIEGNEAQAFLVARSLHSLSALFYQLRTFEGLPPLWYLILFASTHIWSSVLTMQIIHGLIALAMAAALLRFNLPKYILVFLLLGYYFLFEYALISRPYSLSILFLLLAAYELRKNRIDWKLGLFLGLACLSTVHAIILVMCLLPWIKGTFPFLKGGTSPLSRRVRFLIPLAICLICSIISFYPIQGGSIRGALSQVFYHFHFSPSVVFESAGMTLQKAFLPILNVRWPQKWDEGEIQQYIIWAGWLAYLAAAVFISSFGGKKSFKIFITGSMAILAFHVIILYPVTMRHSGYLWIWFLFSLLIVPDAIPKALSNRAGKIILLMFTLVQIPLGITTYASDLIYPFSYAKEAAVWLIKNKPAGKNEVVFGGIPSQILAYTGGKAYDIATGKMLAYSCDLEWLPPERIDPCPTDPAFPDIWIYGEPLDTTKCPRFILRAHFPTSAASEENYWIYERLPK